MNHRQLISSILLAAACLPGSLHAAWHQVFLPVADKSELPSLVASLPGLDPCGTVISEAGIEFPVDDAGLARLQQAGHNPQFVIADLEQHYAERLSASRNYGDYHTYSEGMAEIQQIHADFPSIVSEPIVIGTTLEGNDIWAFKVSDNPEMDEDEPEVLYSAYIHAREAITIEVLLHFVHHLTDNYGTDLRVTDIVNERELWFVPFINPDGVLYNEANNPNGGGMWRKNRRNNGDGSWGVDLNRNFGHFWGYDDEGSSPFGYDETYRGAEAFSEPATQAIRDFVNSRNFTAALTYHSYSNLLLYPWGYDAIHVPEPDHSGFQMITGLMAEHNGYTCGTGWELLYTTNGDTDDWFYADDDGHEKILAITPEVGSSSDGFWPQESRIPTLVAENLEPNLIFAEIAGNPWPLLPPATPELAEIGVTGQDYTISWTTPEPDDFNPATAYELVELHGRTFGEDAFDGDTNWIGENVSFELSSERFSSAPTSYFSNNGNYLNAVSQLAQDIQVEAGMSVEFDCWYEIEQDWDYAYLEISSGGSGWTGLAGSITTNSNPNGSNNGNGITGYSAGWVSASFPLEDYVGQTVSLRLRYTTDGWVSEEGIYVDNFSPVASWESESVIASEITEEFWNVSAQPEGEYWYRVRALDAEGDWSAWSNLAQALVSGGLPQLELGENELIHEVDGLVPVLLHDSLAIGNTGEGSLYWDATLELDAAWPGMIGRDAGGPDDAGYSWLDSAEESGPAVGWVEATENSQPVVFESNDGNEGPFEIGFGFPFYGGTFSQFWINANGFIAFEDPVDAHYQNNVGGLPSVDAPDLALFAWWDDLLTNESLEDVCSYWSNGSDSLVVSWLEAPHYNQASYGGPFTFQVVLEANGRITFNYGDMNAADENSDSGTIGWQVDEALGTEILSMGTPVQDFRSIWILPPHWMQLEAASGVVAPGEVGYLPYQISSYLGSWALPYGQYSATLRLESNDPELPLVEVPVELNVLLVGLDDSLERPAAFTVGEAWPNPFNPTTTIEFDLARQERVQAALYNVAGQHLRQLLNEELPAGSHRLELEAGGLSSGVYLIRFSAGQDQVMRRVLLIK